MIAVALGQVEVPPDAATWYALVVTGVFAGALGYLVATWVQSRTTAARAALVFTLEAPFAALFGVLLAVRAARLGRLDGVRRDARGDRARGAGRRGDAAAPRPRAGRPDGRRRSWRSSRPSCFGAMPVAVRFALGPPLAPTAVGALFTC